MYGRVSKVLEKRNKIRYCKVALHIISYYTIKFDIILIEYYIDANNMRGGGDCCWHLSPVLAQSSSTRILKADTEIESRQIGVE